MAAAAPFIAMGIGMAASTYAAYETKRAGEREEAVHEIRAQQIERTAAEEEAVHREKVKRLMASQRALYAKAGVDIASGSPLIVMAETAAEGEEEAQRIKRTGRESANIERFYGAEARKAGRRKAFGTFLSGMASSGAMLA
jgi:hypothetical protein